MSIIWRIRCDGSKLSPIVPPHCSRMRRQMPRRRRDVVAARPLVVAEQHRAVLERDLHARGRWRTRRCPARPGAPPPSSRPGSSRASPPMNVLTSGTPIFSAAVDDVLEVADDLVAVLGVGVERVRVVAQPGDRQALGRDLVDDLRRLPGGQVRDVDVATCRRSGGSARSARGQQAISRTLEAGRRGPVGHVHERRLGERGGQEAELHRACLRGDGRAAATASGRSTSTQRPSRALRAMASPTSISSWPSANVG